MAPARGTSVNGAAIRALREKEGITVTQLAQRIAVSTAYMSNIEAGRKPRVSPPVVIRLARALDVPRAAIAHGYGVEGIDSGVLA